MIKNIAKRFIPSILNPQSSILNKVKDSKKYFPHSDLGSAKEFVITVDPHDNVLGQAEKMLAHQQALLHRAFSVFIFRENLGILELLLQKRQADKYHCGGLWSNTCCGHPRPEEGSLQAAKRRLNEEMGIETALEAAGSFSYQAHFENGLIEHEIDHVFVGQSNGEPFVPNAREVDEFRWLPLSTLENEIQKQPQQFTPWLNQALNTAMNKIKPSRSDAHSLNPQSSILNPLHNACEDTYR